MVISDLEKKPKKYIDIDICLEAEGIMNDTQIILGESYTVDFRTLNTIRRNLFEKIDKEITKRHYDLPTLREMVAHFDLRQISEVTLTKGELTSLYPTIFEEHFITDEGLLWDHNRHCSLFFMRTFRNLLETVELIADRNVCEEDWDDLSRRFLKILVRFEKVRGFFPFCSECTYNKGESCDLWRSLLFRAFKLYFPEAGDDRSKNLEAIESLKKECTCPKSIEDFRKWEIGANR